jgi:hypothetical protein
MDLASYARAYIGAYLSAVESEGPEHLPMFARNTPYAIEVCFMQNGCFCMLFEKAERSTISVSSQDWQYVMGKVMSGISYLVTVYPHEGIAIEDAVSRGKRDAIRDIRTLESSELVDSIRNLERLIEEMAAAAKAGRSSVKVAESVVAKLEPIRQSVVRSGPSVDMLSMIDVAKNYPPNPQQFVLDADGMKLLTTVVKELGSLGSMVKSSQELDAKVEETEEKLRKELEDFKTAVDKKMAKGLGVILSNTDRKIDKAIGALTPAVEQDDEGLEEPEPEAEEEEAEPVDLVEEEDEEEDEPLDESIEEIEARIEGLADEIIALRDLVARIEMPDLEQLRSIQPDAASREEVDSAIETVHEDFDRLAKRVKRIEDYLTALSARRRQH